jgi:TPR repeat protein
LVDDAIGWYQRAAEAGQTNALWAAADLLVKEDRVAEAITWYERAVSAHR